MPARKVCGGLGKLGSTSMIDTTHGIFRTAGCVVANNVLYEISPHKEPLTNVFAVLNWTDLQLAKSIEGRA